MQTLATNVSDNWYEDFFKGINCELWENAISTDVTRQEVDFLLNELGIQSGQSILDVPCGFGRHAIEFAKKGFNVTGIDISETFIKGLADKIHTEKLSIKAQCADILTVNITQKFSAAVCLGNSFGYFNKQRMKIFVEKVAASLQAGAKFIINSGMVAESVLPNFSHYNKVNVYTVGNITMNVFNQYNVQDSFMVSRLLYTKEGNTEEHIFKHYVYTLGEINRLLKLYGLHTIATYSSTLKEEYTLADKQVYIVAIKT